MPSRHVFLQVALVTSIGFLAVTIAGAQASKFKVLHTFAGGSDGAYPTSGVVFDPAGNLYGTTLFGGSGIGCETGCGTAFELVPSGVRWKERVLYSFSNSADYGIYLFGPLAFDAAGNIYGTSSNGGDPSCECGLAFQLTKSGGLWTENVLHTFLGGTTDGQYPQWGLARDGAGNLYGLANAGGLNGSYGLVFQFTPNGDGTWTYSVIHEFANSPDGNSPYGPLTIDASGNIYGTTASGGSYGYGTVFRFTPSNGAWTETILYNFTADSGLFPQPDGVVMDAAGNLYGAAFDGGQYSVGVIYKLTPTAGFWNRTVLHTFNGSDGAYPFGGLKIDQTGALYGEAQNGGVYGYGTIYKLVQGRHGQWNLAVLHNFSGSDGSYPYGGVTLDQLGNLYGVAELGGAYGLGLAFEIAH